jgi:hypothetical protein
MNRAFAQFVSAIGHPMLILLYVLLLMLATNPFLFGVRSMDETRAVVLIVSVFASTILIPGAGVALMKPLGLVKSLELADKQERIGPYIITGVFYLWLFKNLITLGQTPVLFSKFVLGATIGLFLSFFINIFTKISAHTVGMGGLLAMILLLLSNWQNPMAGIPAFGGTVLVSMYYILILSILLAGAVGSARLALRAHEPGQVYLGYVTGFGAVVVGYAVL